MRLTKEVYKNAFVHALKENGLTVYFNKNNYFILIKGNDSSRIVCIEFVSSSRVDPDKYGSRNNSNVDGIGHFKFNIPKWVEKINYYVFALLNTTNHEIEFVIVPDAELRNRFQNQNRIPTGAKKAEITLWVFPDQKVYDTTGLSLEGEWYFLSKGNSGCCIADGGELDYTEYINYWNLLTDSLVL